MAAPYSGDYHFNGNMSPGFATPNYVLPQTFASNFNQNPYGQNYTPYNTMSPNFMQPPSPFPPAYGQMGDMAQFAQQTPQFQQPPATNKSEKTLTPLEIRGGVMIPNCNCAKKNGLQDACSRSSCMYENAVKRQRRAKMIQQDYPTKDLAAPPLSPAEDANNIIINPAYETYTSQIVPSNAQAIPYNYGM